MFQQQCKAYINMKKAKTKLKQENGTNNTMSKKSNVQHEVHLVLIEEKNYLEDLINIIGKGINGVCR